jgi:hypothetical protein
MYYATAAVVEYKLALDPCDLALSVICVTVSDNNHSLPYPYVSLVGLTLTIHLRMC